MTQQAWHISYDPLYSMSTMRLRVTHTETGWTWLDNLDAVQALCLMDLLNNSMDILEPKGEITK